MSDINNDHGIDHYRVWLAAIAIVITVLAACAICVVTQPPGPMP